MNRNGKNIQSMFIMKSHLSPGQFSFSHVPKSLHNVFAELRNTTIYEEREKKAPYLEHQCKFKSNGSDVRNSHSGTSQFLYISLYVNNWTSDPIYRY